MAEADRPRQRHRSISPRIAATPPSIELRVSDFGVILSEEQIDVRRFLLADPVSLAPVASHIPFATYYCSLLASFEDSHGRNDIVR
jgi:hypothetical protein